MAKAYDREEAGSSSRSCSGRRFRIRAAHAGTGSFHKNLCGFQDEEHQSEPESSCACDSLNARLDAQAAAATARLGE